MNEEMKTLESLFQGEKEMLGREAKIEGFLEAMGVNLKSSILDQSFYEECGKIADDIFSKMETMTGNPVSQEQKHMIYCIVERVTASNMPELTIMQSP